MSSPRRLSGSSPERHDGERSAGWEFACPICRQPLILEDGDARCARCNRVYGCSDQIWRLLPHERLAAYGRFLREYQEVREAEGWARPDAGYVLSLPDVAVEDPQHAVWQRRRRSYRVLLAKVVEPMAARYGRPLRILDLGAGNCWLAYRLALRGHQVAAVDLSVDTAGGLGAHRWYRPEIEKAGGSPIIPIQAEFDHLPRPDGRVDVAVFNASLHYSADCAVTLREALRVTRADGAVVIMDTPLYRQAADGLQMVREREQAFQRRYGFPSDALPAEHFLTTTRLRELARELGLRWQVHRRRAGRSWANRHWRKLRGLRELAEMPVIAGYRR